MRGIEEIKELAKNPERIKEMDKGTDALVGMRIRELREKAGLEVVDIADVLDIGTDMVSRLENGRSTLRSCHIYILAQLYGISAHYIMFGEDEYTLSGNIEEICRGKNIEDLRKAEDMLRILFR